MERNLCVRQGLRSAFVAVASVMFVVAATTVTVSGRAMGDERIEFNRDIRPILSDRCFFCHGPDEEERQADLRLDVEEAAKDYAIIAGRPDESEVIARIVSDDPDLRMPPPDSGKSLTKAEIETLTRWVRQGAEYQPHWAYVPPVRHPVPDVPESQADWPRNWTDHFIADQLDREGLAPSDDADAATLVRRLSFDLTGLPPSPEDVAWFREDPSEARYEEYVDRLLASDRFGERMAVYWLDLVRYADTVGYHGDQDHNISPYRDYVIDAFNDNLPFDRFTREQLAGDLLPEPTIDQQIATGYNRLLQTSHEGGVQPKEYMSIYFADRVRNVSAVWMGATMGCCQCHNHKYDPYTIEDFYAMGAFFADIDEAQHFRIGSNSLPTKRPPEIDVLAKRDREALAKLRQDIERLAAGERDDAGNGAGQLEELRAREKEIESRRRKTMVTRAIAPREIRVLPRGDWLDDSGPVVMPEVPEFMHDLGLSEGIVEEDEAEPRRRTRLDLAEWLVDPNDGAGRLTARVQVNRFWYLFFGTGLAKVLDDFGGQGEPPVHPELLDNLAVEFVEHGWDVKHLVKMIVTSRTYRQSSAWTEALLERDPYNQLFARQSRYRLPSEMIRDQALDVSGLLVLEYGGASVKPYQPAGYYRHLNFPKRTYKHDGGSAQWRRGVYVHWQRQFLHPMLAATDAPSREECTAERPRSNTPIAALVLLNDPTFVEAARTFAERALLRDDDDDDNNNDAERGDSGDGDRSDEERVVWMYEEALFRQPSDFERDTLTALLDHERQAYAGDHEAAEKIAAVGLAEQAADIDVVELAAWTSVARAILNLDETITRR